MSRALGFVVAGSILSFGGLTACAQGDTGAGDVSGAGAVAPGGGGFTQIGGAGGKTGSGGGPSGGAPGSGGFSGSNETGGESGAAGEPASGGEAGTSGGGSSPSGGGGPNGGSGGSSATGGGPSGGGSGGSSAGGGSGGTPSGGGGSGGTSAKGDCCSDNPGTKGCTNSAVEQCVCNKNPFCCNQYWDDACAGEVLSLKCGTCTTPTDCCQAGSQNGCSSVAVSSCVCDSDYSCCSSGWSAACVGKVNSLGCGTCAAPPVTGVVWINEIHYDNASTDAAEGIEVAGTAGVDLTGFKLVFYNGNPTQLLQYSSKTLSGTIPNQQNGFGTLWFAQANMQNGGADATPEPDGVALIDAAGKVVQVLSYEGAFTPADGPAKGAASTDIGKSELSTSPAGQSLQLTGTGKKYTDFTWAGSATATAGQKNNGQTFQ